MKMIPPRTGATPRLLSGIAASCLVAGCGGGSTSPSYQLPGTSQSTRAQIFSSAVAVRDASCLGQRSFQYVGHAQRFKVPKCATTIYVDAEGASGKYGGDGGEVSATIPVTPPETLIVTVGGTGHNLKGGFNGGAAGVPWSKKIRGGGGGGATDVRQGGSALADRVLVAGGGGGSTGGDPVAGAGGTGGGVPDGGAGGTPSCNFGGPPIGGGGGTQTSGGSGGAGGNGGSLGNGGPAGVGSCAFVLLHSTTVSVSGGGGGGYYGGGGGGAGGAGGGGSGYAEPAASDVSSQNGVNSGNGSALICWGYSNGECGSR
jgi:hypothetical protein